MGLMRVASSVLVLHLALDEAASRAGISPLVHTAVAAAAGARSPSIPSSQLQSLGEEDAAGLAPTVSVEQVLSHQRRVDSIFVEVFNRIQALFGGPMRGAPAPLAPGQAQMGPPGGGGPPASPQTPSSLKAAEKEARRSDYILQKRKEMEAALASWMAVMEGGEAVPKAEQEAAEQQGLAAVRFLSQILSMSPKQFNKAFYKAHPINPALSSLHRQPTELTDLVPLLQAVNHAVEAEAEAQQKAAAAGRKPSQAEAGLFIQRKMQALVALRNQAKSNRRLAKIRARVYHEASWALKPGDKLKAELEVEHGKWLEQQDKADEAISHCKLLGLKVTDRQRPLPAQEEETVSSPSPLPPVQPELAVPPQPLIQEQQAPASPPSPPVAPILPTHRPAPAATTQALPTPEPRPHPTPAPHTTLIPAGPPQATIPQMPVLPAQPSLPQHPMLVQPSPQINAANYYKGRVAALSRMFGADESSEVQQQQQQLQQQLQQQPHVSPLDQGPHRPSSPRPADLRLLKRSSDMDI
ncbi:hypothetical protein Emed_004495 [Eimeria media]